MCIAPSVGGHKGVPRPPGTSSAVTGLKRGVGLQALHVGTKRPLGGSKLSHDPNLRLFPHLFLVWAGSLCLHHTLLRGSGSELRDLCHALVVRDEIVQRVEDVRAGVTGIVNITHRRPTSLQVQLRLSQVRGDRKACGVHAMRMNRKGRHSL